MTPAMLAALTRLEAAEEPLTGHELGGAISDALVASGRRGIGQRGSRYAGPGNLAGPVMSALKRKGLVTPAAIYRFNRMDFGWRITRLGALTLADTREPGDCGECKDPKDFEWDDIQMVNYAPILVCKTHNSPAPGWAYTHPATA